MCSVCLKSVASGRAVQGVPVDVAVGLNVCQPCLLSATQHKQMHRGCATYIHSTSACVSGRRGNGGVGGGGEMGWRLRLHTPFEHKQKYVCCSTCICSPAA